MVYAAIDIHKRIFQAAVLDADSGELVQERLPATRDAPSLPMSCETVMTKELLSPEGENGARCWRWSTTVPAAAERNEP